MNKKSRLALVALAAIVAVLTFAVITEARSGGHGFASHARSMPNAMTDGRGHGGGMGAGMAAPSQLSAAEAAGLQYMVEEEKLAHDVYTALGARYPDAPFTMIAQSEQRHQAAVQRQLARAGISDPTSDRAAGTFADPKLQHLYDSLIKRGTTSRTAALQVGALIERTDIGDLRSRSDATSDATIKRVYGHLERASEQHLRIFGTEIQTTSR